jgi:uncharacterized protein (TIGR00297 family)
MLFSPQIASVSAGSDMISGRQLWMALAVTVAFAGLARVVRGVTFSGAVAGGVVCFVLYACAGPGAFAALVSVFVLAWITTRLGYQQKQTLGTAERREGRSASQVLANLSVAAVCAAIYAVLDRDRIFLLAIAAALSEAGADTVSSEFGQARTQNARLITTWEQVPAGTNGGVSLAGTLAGVAAAVIVGLVGVFSRLLSWRWLGVSVTAAIAGMLADSYMGASLERRRWLNNDAVNFLSTLVAAAVALLLA